MILAGKINTSPTKPTMKPIISGRNFFRMDDIFFFSYTAKVTKAFTLALSTPRNTTWFCVRSRQRCMCNPVIFCSGETES